MDWRSGRFPSRQRMDRPASDELAGLAITTGQLKHMSIALLRPSGCLVPESAPRAATSVAARLWRRDRDPRCLRRPEFCTRQSSGPDRAMCTPCSNFPRSGGGPNAGKRGPASAPHLPERSSIVSGFAGADYRAYDQQPPCSGAAAGAQPPGTGRSDPC